ncbi:FHA domain-containing protein [Acidobacteriota bacterium]
MAKLTVYQGDGVKGLFKIRKDVVTIGRVNDCDVEILASSISRHHARVERRVSGYWIIDNNSTNGTLVNGQEVTEKRLTDGDEIYMGDVVVLFSYDEWEYEETKREPTTPEEVEAVLRIKAKPVEKSAPASEPTPRPPVPVSPHHQTTTTAIKSSDLKKQMENLKAQKKKKEL